jgi:signal transduction histidine kinase
MSDIHLNTVLQNIISNAVSTLQIIQRFKFIEVITKVDNERSIIIKDNGIGFDSNFQKRSFSNLFPSEIACFD